MTPNDLPTVACPDPQLRQGAQGIARVAVDDGAAQLVVTFFDSVTTPQNAYSVNPRSYSLAGGERLFPRIVAASIYNPSGTPPDLVDRRVLLQLDAIGDFSIYTLTVNGPDVDPFFASHKFRFRLACEDPFDCRPEVASPVSAIEEQVVIDYLAKDYASFRQALLDFIPTRLPSWTERSEADVGMMLLELLAATADTLSYTQDRVANEAFLNTATQRRSVAGHLALIDYQIDEGASAHTWLQFQVNTVTTLSANPGLRVSTRPRRPDEPIVVFETLTTATFYPEHNQMSIYDWGNQACCLPRTSTTAALVGRFENLKAGDYVLFDDGNGRRDVVRITATPEIISADPIKAKPDGPITVVRWTSATPLHYDFCAPNTVARGNLVLATHGETVRETLRDLNPSQKIAVEAEAAARKPWQRVPRQRLRLSQAPLAHLDSTTQALVTPLPVQGSATPNAESTSIIAEVPRSVSTLAVDVDGEQWQERTSLLDSRADEPVFRVEIDDRGDATVVFGDGTFGRRPDETSTVVATYRVGGGSIGNLAADTLVVPRPRATESVPWLVSVTNPLPSVGGRDLESRDHARRFGPATFQKPLVAVTEADYEAAAQEFVDALGRRPIQRANAQFRWTGSWLTVTLAVDPRDADGVTPELRRALLAYLDTRRLAGYDLEVTPALYVPIDLTVEFCTRPGFRDGDVQQGIQRVLSTAELPGGLRGFFHPDNFSFGDSLYVSQLYAVIMAVPGIESAQITRLARLRSPRADEETAANLRQGYLEVGPDQIVRLDDDRNFPQNGTLTVRPKGAT